MCVHTHTHTHTHIYIYIFLFQVQREYKNIFKKSCPRSDLYFFRIYLFCSYICVYFQLVAFVTLHPRFNKKKFIIECIGIIPNNNTFQFNNINYIQTLGTAMETKMAPTYATLTLTYLEENLYEIIGKKYGNDIKKEFTMEKIFGWLLNNLEIPMGDINELHNLLQNQHLKIKFTMEHSSKELPFLDTFYNKHKWPNHHGYLTQTNRYPTIP